MGVMGRLYRSYLMPGFILSISAPPTASKPAGSLASAGHSSLLVQEHGDVRWAFERRETPEALLLLTQYISSSEVLVIEEDASYG